MKNRAHTHLSKILDRQNEKGVLGFAFFVEIYCLKRTSSCRVTFVLLIDTAGSTVSSGYNPIQLVMTTPDDDLSADQRRALELVLAGSNVLVTGPGGTGKTFLIRRIVQRLLEKGKQPAVTALTGAAAALMTDIGARTLHSWGGILARDDVPAEDKARRVLRKRDIRDRWRETDLLVIDEVSMMSPKLAIDVDVIARHVRGTQRGYKERQTQPFGGLQVVFVGDFFLPDLLDLL